MEFLIYLAVLLTVLPIAVNSEAAIAQSKAIVTEVNGRTDFHFEDQLKLHRLKKKGETLGSLQTLSQRDFLDHHMLQNVNYPGEFVVVETHTMAATQVTYTTSRQVINGVEVFGSNLMTATGAHGGVIRSSVEGVITTANFVSLPSTPIITAAQVDGTIHEAILQRYNCTQEFNREIVKESLVYYQHGGLYKLVRHSKTSAVVPTQYGNMGIVYDGFVDAITGELEDLIINDDYDELQLRATGQRKLKKNLRSKRKLLDPSGGIVDFSDFLQSPIKVYDCQYQSSCPPNPPVMWDSTVANPVWPTTDNEINQAVGITVQLTRVIRAISGGVWQSYRRVNAELKIHLHINMQNAYYNGVGIYFGADFVTDDVVAHEWAHGYCDYSSNLVYRDESGAMNEANSDVFGEAIDILNSQDSVTSIGAADMVGMANPRAAIQSCSSENWPRMTLSPGTDSSRQWLMGEEVGGGIGVIRDMYYPECFGDPGAMGSASYYCGSGDNGGVHYNSGVGNRAFALLVQGGQDANGNIMSPIGMTKALSLHWGTVQNINSQATYRQYATEIEAQCQDAIGGEFYYPDLYNVGNHTAFGGVVTLEDCNKLAVILENTQMHYPVDYASCTVSIPTPPPTSPTYSPTAFPTGDNGFPETPTSLAPFSTSDTDTCRQNTVDATFPICPGSDLEIKACGVDNCSGDTYFKLVDSQGVVKAENDDSCGLCSTIRYQHTGLECGMYTLRQGCFSNGLCSGTTTITNLAAPVTRAPTLSPTTETSAVPTVVPTVTPTVAPTVTPTVTPTAIPTFTPSAIPTAIPTVGTTNAPTAIPTVGATAIPTVTSTVGTTNAPTDIPTTVPTTVPTAIPTVGPLPSLLPAYDTAYTVSATMNTADFKFVAGGGSVYTFSTCPVHGGQCSEDTYLRLFDSHGIEVASNDDKCGHCAAVSYYFQGSAAEYTLKAGCFSNSMCSGQVKVIDESAPSPTVAPTALVPTELPTELPTQVPTATPTFPPTVGIPAECAPFQKAFTNSSTINYQVCEIFVAPSTRLNIRTCNEDKSCMGDTFLRLFDSRGNQLAANDDDCGYCSGIEYTFTEPHQRYEIREGCFGDAVCSGTTKITITA